jgi:hypothetical protein
MPPEDDSNYDYAPKPPQSKSPVTPHEFKVRYYACNMRCSILEKTILRPFHRCRQFCHVSQEAMTRIPKRNCRLDGQGREYFWGIFAIEKGSYFRLIIYHILALVLPLIFWFLWLFYWNHQADLQNASVPFTTVISLLSLLWFPFLKPEHFAMAQLSSRLPAI